MTFTPTNWQTLLLWSLIAEGGQGWQKDRKWNKFKAIREGLEKEGLIESTKNGGYFLEVTDKGWAWSAENLAAPLPKTQHTVPILRAFLSRLQAYLKANDASLAEFVMTTVDVPVQDKTVTPPSSSNSSSPLKKTPVLARDTSGPDKNLDEQIREACLKIADGKSKVRIRLHQLREFLPDIKREKLDQTLLDMQLAGELVLMPLDNVREITPADREAALHIADDPHHILYFGG